MCKGHSLNTSSGSIFGSVAIISPHGFGGVAVNRVIVILKGVLVVEKLGKPSAIACVTILLIDWLLSLGLNCLWNLVSCPSIPLWILLYNICMP